MYIYIKQAKRNDDLIKKVDMPKILNKVIIMFKKTFNLITIKKIDEKHYLYIIPKINNVKLIEKIINKNAQANIILSKELKKHSQLLNIKEEKMIKYYICNILKYIMDKLNTKLEVQNIYICVNDYKQENEEVIKYLIDKVKTVNIVTDNINKYKKLEEKLYNEKGILIVVSNNKNKALKKANFIINIDFENEELKKYSVNRNSIIINNSNQKIDILYFQGIIINDINVTIKEKEEYKELYEDFDKIDVFNTFEINSIKYIENVKKIQESEIIIQRLVGNNGIINIKEIVNMKNNPEISFGMQ